MAQATQGPVFKDITPAAAMELIQTTKGSPDFMILDVRTSQEFNSGHIEGAFYRDYYSRYFQSELASLDKDATYLVYCRTGNRSGKTLALMRRLGFSKVYNVLGGVVQWTREGYKLVK